ncbi:MAG: hypothetical protein K2G51_00640, partial [Lachnospiraceae bacterium]|nr:hypothetical protein [Lachnospiraceae bacterium]
GNYCKHMAAVLYEWSASGERSGDDNSAEQDLFATARTAEAYTKRADAIQKLVESAEISVVQNYLASILKENEKLLVRFYSMVKGKSEKEDVGRYTRQVDAIAERYLGRDRFISYREANSFISELGNILSIDGKRMIDNGQYMSAFELMNYIFVLVGNVDIDDSDGGTGMLAEEICQLWIELLAEVDADEKEEMFHWFTTHLDGSVIDYMEEYIERIIMEEFAEKEYRQQKISFVEQMIEKSEKKDSEWSRNYYVGKWALCYLDLLEKQQCSRAEIEDFCRKHWENSSVRKYYIDKCMQEQEYDAALKALDESISFDKERRNLVAEHSEKKKQIYLLQGDKEAYIRQLWEMILDHKAGDAAIYRELREQYSEEEWRVQREQIYSKLPRYAHVEELYKEEKLYDRLLECVLKSSGLSALHQFWHDLKDIYPEQFLQKYKEEVNRLASQAKDRRRYQELVKLLRGMQKIKGGAKAVEAIVEEWKVQYRNRPALIDELEKL